MTTREKVWMNTKWFVVYAVMIRGVISLSGDIKEYLYPLCTYDRHLRIGFVLGIPYACTFWLYDEYKDMKKKIAEQDLTIKTIVGGQAEKN